MSIGPLLRAMFGKHEHWVTDAYRRLYVNIDELAAHFSFKKEDWSILNN